MRAPRQCPGLGFDCLVAPVQSGRHCRAVESGASEDGGVDDVGGEDQVVAVRIDPLLGGRLLDVEGRVFDERRICEALLSS